MNFDLKTLNLAAAAEHKSDLLVLLVEEGFQPGQDALSGLIAQALQNGDFEGKAGKNLQLYQFPSCAARRLVLLSIGDGSLRSIKTALQAVAGLMKLPAVKRAAIVFAAAPAPAAVACVVQSVTDGQYLYTTSKTKNDPRPLSRVVIGVDDPARVQEAFSASLAVAEGVAFAREWGNRPANYATPTQLAHAAKGLGKLPGIHCKVLGPDEVKDLGMGAFLAVAQGSHEPLRFIELRYNGAGKNLAPVVLVGKGITFDTGGISIKPAGDMDEMKFDMCGAASVLGTFRALAELQPAINVVGLIPACENMPDGRSVKPGDVVTSMSGQTIEVLNTDAEGRLVLCDALTYAARFKPAAVVDIATLTGACVIALGGVRSGLFSSDDGLAQQLLDAGEQSHDLCWRMPLDEEYGEGLKSNFADMGNVAGRAGGSITAAKFLQRYTGSLPWAHLDIAGTAWKSGAAKGSTGRPVGLLVQYLLNVANNPVLQPAPKAVAKTEAAAKATKAVKPSKTEKAKKAAKPEKTAASAKAEVKVPKAVAASVAETAGAETAAPLATKPVARKTSAAAKRTDKT